MLLRFIAFWICLGLAVGLPCQAAVRPLTQQKAQATPSIRSYPVAGGGTFKIELPTDWREEIQQTDQSHVNIIYRPSGNPSFEIMVSPIKADKPEALGERKIYEGVLSSSQKIAPNSVERSLSVVSLKGTSVNGFYFVATDKRPVGPGEFKKLAQGILTVGDLIVPFTILYNPDTPSFPDAALSILRGVGYQR